MADADIHPDETITHRRLRMVMEHHGIALSRACRLAGLDLNLLRQFYKRPTGGIRADTLAKLADILGCTVAYLTGESDDIALGEPGVLGTPKPSQAPLTPLAMRIRHFRVLRCRTQAALSRKLGVSTAMVSAWETGLTEPTPERRAQMGKIFGIDLMADALEPEVQAAVDRMEKAHRPMPPNASTGPTSARLDLSMHGTMAHIMVEATVPWEIGVQIAALVREHAVPEPF